MKKLFIIATVLIAFQANSQIRWGVKNYNFYPFNGIRVDSVFTFPDTSYRFAPNGSGAWMNHKFFIKDTTWKQVTGSSAAAGAGYGTLSNGGNLDIDTTKIIKTSTNVTYASLVSLKAGSFLVPGQHYKITDFQTVYKVYGTSDQVSATTEPLVVVASSFNTLSPIAYTATHPEDVIYYSLTDNTPLAPTTGSKGVITYREDTKNNLSAYYDFRNVKWRRWSLANGGLYYAFGSGTPAYSAGQYLDTLTFMGTAHDIHIGSGSYNTTIGDGCFDIKIGNGCGAQGAGIYIAAGSWSISIDDECSTVQTSGAGYIGGIYIGGTSRDIRIGARSYNIQIGSNCYALDLGVQNSDVFIPNNTFRRRLEKGYSNFEITVPLSGKTLDLYAVNITVLGSFLYGPANYCGVIYVTSSNATDTLDKVNALTTSVNWSDKEIVPTAGLTLLVRDKTVASVSGSNVDLGGANLSVNGTSHEEAVFHKRMIDGTGSQPTDFYLTYTNKQTSGGGGGGGGSSSTPILETFTGSTSTTITLSHTPLAGTEEYKINGVGIDPSNVSRTGTSVTITLPYSLETSDVITAKYSY